MAIREDLSKQLHTLLYDLPYVHGVWEAGSTATGFLDEYSDLDLSIIVDPNHVNDVYLTLDTFFENHYGILRKYRVKEPTWHGFSQCFYQLHQTPLPFYLDIGVIKETIDDKFMASDRHGTPAIWFEKKPIYRQELTSEVWIKNKVKELYSQVTDVDFILSLEVEKALLRKRFVEAKSMAIRFIERQVATLLNIIYRPVKVDFGFRYAHRDYPPTVNAWIEKIYRAGNLIELEKAWRISFKHYEDLKVTAFETINKLK